MKETYNFGLFETVRSYKGRIIYLNEHLLRLRKSAELAGLKMPFNPRRLKAMINKAVKINNFKDAYIKLILLGAADNKCSCFIIVKVYKPYSKQKYSMGFKAIVSKFRQLDPYLAQMKSTKRFLYESAFAEAKEKGADEAVILNKHGSITEGSRTNVFFVKGKELFTPSVSCGCLNGITRKLVIDLAKAEKIKVTEGKFSPRDLYEAEEVFLTNSLMGIMPLSRLNGKKIGVKNAKMTKIFINKYNSILNAH
ncbi:MAG: hypothetical protein FJZ15_01635 [Candidatus Omnitrophica bacterium]|nr:hypothetical protein [Candidatus Omnitrophota bacterium]